MEAKSEKHSVGRKLTLRSQRKGNATPVCVSYARSTVTRLDDLQ